VTHAGYLALTKDEFIQKIANFYKYQTGIGTNMLIMTVISFIIGLSISGQMACALSNCAVGPTFHRPEPPPVDHYSNGTDPTATPPAHGTAQRFDRGAAAAADWWWLFRSPQLDAVITEAIDHNPGLDAARQLTGEPKRFARRIRHLLSGNRCRGRRHTRAIQPHRVRAENSVQHFQPVALSASVSYALDVFGGQRRLVEGLRAKVDVAHANERATYLALSANIANTVVAGAAYRAEIEATQQLIELQRQQVGIANVQAEVGTVPYSNVLALRSQLAANEASVPQLEQKLVQSGDLLAALAGHTPAEWQAPAVRLEDLTLPADLPVSLPSDLVRQRPDILAAEATAHAASANIGVATAALLPSVTLNGSIGTAANTTGILFSSRGKAWSLGADAAAPLFEGGTLWYRRKAALDDYNQAIALYRQTMLGAFERVTDTLRSLDHDASAASAEDEALSSAAVALRLVQANYEAGIATYLDVLLADTQYHQAKIADLQLIAVRYQDTVALFAALGGGWWNAQPKAAQLAP
jgi:NodT family efflux transporter outer membrane factor (OMF) lipoprotein